MFTYYILMVNSLLTCTCANGLTISPISIDTSEALVHLHSLLVMLLTAALCLLPLLPGDDTTSYIHVHIISASTLDGGM